MFKDAEDRPIESRGVIIFEFKFVVPYKRFNNYISFRRNPVQLTIALYLLVKDEGVEKYLVTWQTPSSWLRIAPSSACTRPCQQTATRTQGWNDDPINDSEGKMKNPIATGATIVFSNELLLIGGLKASELCA